MMLILLAFTFSAAMAQEVKEEKKVVKIKVTSDENAEVSVDTTIIFDEDFDGDLEELIEDEELMEQLEDLDIDIDLEIEDGGKVYILKSPSTQKRGYTYITSHKGDKSYVMVEDAEEDMIVDIIDGDTTITVIVKPNGDMKECKKEVIVWHAGADGKNIAHNKMLMSQNMSVDMELIDGDTVLTYTLEMEGDGDEHGKNVIFWTSDEQAEGEHEIIIKKMGSKAELNEFIIHDELPMIITQTIIISNIDADDKSMLSDAGIKFGKEELHINNFTLNMDPDSENIKISFEVHELKNVSISMLNGIGSPIYMEELKKFSGKYIREIELPEGQTGDYFFHVKAGNKSISTKISIE